MAWLLLCGVALAWPAPASADVQPAESSGPIVAFTAYAGQVPEHESAQVVELRADLAALGFAAEPRAITPLVADALPLPGVLDRGAKPTGLTRAELLDLVEVGYQAWASANFDEAAAILVRALARIRRNPALLVTDTSNLNVIYKAHLTLALSLAKLEKTAESEAIMEELIRMFPAQPVVRGESGPEAWDLYRSVSRHVHDMGRGRLVVNTGSDQAIIFVDGQLRGTSHIDLPDLVPGVHRVFVQVVGTLGRQYQIKIAANQVNTLKVNWDIDQTIWLTDSIAAIVFPTASDRTKEGAFASELVRHWGGQQIAIVAPQSTNGRVAMFVTIYDAAGEVIRRASVGLDRDASPRLRALARFAQDGTADPSLNVIATETPIAAEDRTARHAWPMWAGPAVLGAGMAVTVAGVVVFKSAANDDGHVPLLHDRREIGLGVSLLGSAAAGGGVYLWCRHEGIRPLPAALMSTGAAAFTYGIALYAVDEDPSPQLGTRIIDSATAGVIVGSAGIAVAGAGLWVWLRGNTGTAPPVVAVQRGGGLLAWGGSF